MHFWTKHHKKIIFFAAILMLLVPFAHAHADTVFPSAGSLVKDGLVALLTVVFSFVGQAIAKLSNWLEIVLRIRLTDSIVIVSAGWTIMRNFANMFFIVALIVMAFGTIFQVGPLKGYNFNSMIVSFLIAALLINFSLVLGNLVIDGTQVFNDIFLNSMGSIGNKLNDGLNPASLITGGTRDPQTGEIKITTNGDVVTTVIISLLFALILFLVFLFSLSAAFLFAIIRIPVIWGLLIIAPMAWMAYAFPATKKLLSKWWSEFISWNLLLPIFLFALYFALYFLSKQNEIVAAAHLSNESSFGVNLLNSFSLQMLFFYMLVCLFLIGGPMLALSTSKVVSGSALKAFGWARGTLTSNVPIFRAGAGLSQAVSNIRKELATKQQAKIQQSATGWERKFGGLAGIDQSKAFGRQLAEQNKAMAKLTDLVSLGKYAKNGSDVQRIAAIERLKGLDALGSVDADTKIKALKLHAKADPAGARKFGASLDYKDWSKEDRSKLESDKGSTDFEVRRQLLMSMAEKGDFKDAATLQAKSKFFGENTEARKKFMTGAEKKSALASIEAQLKMGMIKDDKGNKLGENDLATAIGMKVDKMSARDIFENDLHTTYNKMDVTDPNKAVLQGALEKRSKEMLDYAKSSRGTMAQRNIAQDLYNDYVKKGAVEAAAKEAARTARAASAATERAYDSAARQSNKAFDLTQELDQIKNEATTQAAILSNTAATDVEKDAAERRFNDLQTQQRDLESRITGLQSKSNESQNTARDNT